MTPEDQKKIVQCDRQRHESRRVAKRPLSYAKRTHDTQSVESLMADLRVDIFTATRLKILFNQEQIHELMEMVSVICDVKPEYKDLFHHERVLFLFASALDAAYIGQMSIVDGFPAYKFVVPRDLEDYTIVYDVYSKVFYLDVVAAIQRKNPDMQVNCEYLKLEHRKKSGV